VCVISKGTVMSEKISYLPDLGIFGQLLWSFVVFLNTLWLKTVSIFLTVISFVCSSLICIVK